MKRRHALSYGDLSAREQQVYRKLAPAARQRYLEALEAERAEEARGGMRWNPAWPGGFVGGDHASGYEHLTQAQLVSKLVPWLKKRGRLDDAWNRPGIFRTTKGQSMAAHQTAEGLARAIQKAEEAAEMYLTSASPGSARHWQDKAARLRKGMKLAKLPVDATVWTYDYGVFTTPKEAVEAYVKNVGARGAAAALALAETGLTRPAIHGDKPRYNPRSHQ